MINEKSRYLICDAYPDPLLKDGNMYVGAIIGCWIRLDLCVAEEDAYQFITNKLSGKWVITEVLESSVLERKSCNSKNDQALKFFEQSLIDGFVSNIHRCPIETIMLTDLQNGEEELSVYELLNEECISQDAVSLYSDEDKQWANGVSPNGEEFIPIWFNLTTSNWKEYWPNYKPCRVKRNELFDFLLRIYNLECRIGLGVYNQITTMHPLALRDLLIKEAG